MTDDGRTLSISGPATPEEVAAVIEALRSGSARPAHDSIERDRNAWRAGRLAACGYFCRWPAPR